ncbi:uncharacterized protein LOC124146514 isoform X1 [Haliotis rufescens]|uniref:uncharacterized protein LOC124146514 isoform X1 n=1 Tax=Haliotis rufescens TaxID=6454 RepID=UPI00201E7EA8|nr:uncharacterized protein LOC124146514 isoform X1 [Haliotis rufescens]
MSRRQNISARTPPQQWPDMRLKTDLHVYLPHSPFPTEIVIGGTLGTLSLIAIVFIIIAAVRKWQIKRRQRFRHPHHRPIKKTRLVPWFGEPVLAYDISVRDKVYRAYDNYATDVYYPAAHSTPRAMRMHGYHDNSSDNALCTLGEDSHYEPSIIAGSFVYHPPSNLPPHLVPDYNQNLSYDSFKNEHLYENNTRGVVSSTLNNHHQPPDFYL